MKMPAVTGWMSKRIVVHGNCNSAWELHCVIFSIWNDGINRKPAEEPPL